MGDAVLFSETDRDREFPVTVLRPFPVQIAGNTSAFGDAMFSPLTPKISISAIYGIRDNVVQFTATGGTVSSTNNEFVCQTGTNVGGYAVVQSRIPLVHLPGLGSEGRITGRFTSPVANSLQAVGMFSATSGMFVGYNGTNFGVMHRYDGQLEIRTLTISVASNAAATATVTLNGVAYTAAVTSATAAVNASEIATALRASNAALEWNIQDAGDELVFQYRGATEKNGTYSLSVSTGTLSGSFARTNAGKSPTEDWTYQAAWNVNTCPWLKPTKGNIYRFEHGYLGYGIVRFSVYDPSLLKFTPIHVVEWPNNREIPNFPNPSMRIGWVSASLGSTTNLTVAGASAMGATQGAQSRFHLRTFGSSTTATSVTTELSVILLQVRQTFYTAAVNGIIVPKALSISTGSQIGAVFRLYRNPTIAAPVLWNYENKNQSAVLFSNTSVSLVGSTEIANYTLGSNGSSIIYLDDLDIDLVAGDIFVVSAERISGAAADMSASVTWMESI